MCLERQLSHLQERSLTGRLHKLAAAGDVRAKDIAELATLRQKLVGLAGSERSPDLLDPFADEAENCLDQNMLMMCNRIRSGAPLLRIQPFKKHFDDGALQKHHVWDAMRVSSSVCAPLVIGVLCCWFALVIPHPSSLTVVAEYSDDACAEILLVTVLIVEPSLSQAATPLHVHERLCNLHTLDDTLRRREDVAASHPIPVPPAPESNLHIECPMIGIHPSVQYF